MEKIPYDQDMKRFWREAAGSRLVMWMKCNVHFPRHAVYQPGGLGSTPLPARMLGSGALFSGKGVRLTAPPFCGTFCFWLSADWFDCDRPEPLKRPLKCLYPLA